MSLPTTPIVLEVWDAIKTKIAVNYAAGYSGLDLSSSVFQGRFTDAPLVGSAYVAFVDSTESNGQVLTRYQGTLRYQVYCFNYGSNNYDRTASAIKLGADVHNSLTADRTLGLASGRIDNIIVEMAALDGDEFGMNTMGIAILDIRVIFQSDRGF
jgi:hypothetical protein